MRLPTKIWSLPMLNLEAKVRARTAELTKSNRVREKLLSVVSHDIKSPLNSLRGVLNVYRQGGFTESEMKSLTTHIDENLNSTTMLVDNILAVDFPANSRVLKLLQRKSI